MSPRYTTVYRKLLAFVWLLTLILHLTSSNETNKPGPLASYCGKAFVAAWGHCCGGRYPACTQAALNSVNNVNQGRRKRDIEEDNPFQQSWKAKRFFNRRITRSNAVAAEECCYEQCSLREISEYPCF